MSVLDREPGIATFTEKDSLRDWRDIDHEIQQMGHRLDHVRAIISKFKKSKKKDDWKIKYWTTIESQVLKKWKMLDTLRRTKLRTNYREKKAIDYSWWEPHYGIGQGRTLPEWMTIQADLRWSWENARDESVQKARKGLA
jgi:hypothetical protein